MRRVEGAVAPRSVATRTRAPWLATARGSDADAAISCVGVFIVHLRDRGEDWMLQIAVGVRALSRA
jgi:hypothetical protein